MYWNLCLPQNFICPIVVPIVVSPSSITPDPKLSQPAKVSEHECIPEENSN